MRWTVKSEAEATEAIPYGKLEELLRAGAAKDIASGRDMIAGSLKQPGKPDHKPQQNTKAHFLVVHIALGWLRRVGLEAGIVAVTSSETSSSTN